MTTTPSPSPTRVAQRHQANTPNGVDALGDAMMGWERNLKLFHKLDLKAYANVYGDIGMNMRRLAATPEEDQDEIRLLKAEIKRGLKALSSMGNMKVLGQNLVQMDALLLRTLKALRDT